MIDISRPSAPVEVGFSEAAHGAERVAVEGSYAYVASGSDGRWVVDVSTPPSPVAVGRYGTSEFTTGAALGGGRVFAAETRTGFEVFRTCDWRPWPPQPPCTLAVVPE